MTIYIILTFLMWMLFILAGYYMFLIIIEFYKGE